MALAYIANKVGHVMVSNTCQVLEGVGLIFDAFRINRVILACYMSERDNRK